MSTGQGLPSPLPLERTRRTFFHDFFCKGRSRSRVRSSGGGTRYQINSKEARTKDSPVSDERRVKEGWEEKKKVVRALHHVNTVEKDFFLLFESKSLRLIHLTLSLSLSILVQRCSAPRRRQQRGMLSSFPGELIFTARPSLAAQERGGAAGRQLSLRRRRQGRPCPRPQPRPLLLLLLLSTSTPCSPS